MSPRRRLGWLLSKKGPNYEECSERRVGILMAVIGHTSNTTCGLSIFSFWTTARHGLNWRSTSVEKGPQEAWTVKLSNFAELVCSVIGKGGNYE